MPAQTFHLKRGDTLPVLEVVLVNPDGSVHDLTGSTDWKLHVKLDNGQTFSRTMTKVGADVDGKLSYGWQAADWTASPPLAVGTHRMEYEVVGAGTARMTFPNDGYDILRVTQDLGDA